MCTKLLKKPLTALSNAVCALRGDISRVGQRTGEILLQLKGSLALASAWQHLGWSCQWQEHLPEGTMNWSGKDSPRQGMIGVLVFSLN